jgi:hypothetical protein
MKKRKSYGSTPNRLRINQAVTIRFNNKNLPAKVASVGKGNYLFEALANGKRFVCENHGGNTYPASLL